MNGQYKSWCKWHPLKTVMVGRTYHPEFYRDIKNSKIRDSLVRIAEETEEDYQNYVEVLEDFGCEVIRPELDINESIMDHLNDEETLQYIPRPPGQPRDGQLVMGTQLLYTTEDHPAIREKLDQYSSNSITLFDEISRTSLDEILEHTPRMSKNKYDVVKGADWPEYAVYIELDLLDLPKEIVLDICKFENNFRYTAPCITCVGKDVYVDIKELQEQLRKFMYGLYPERRFTSVEIGKHTDACFHTLKPGAILSLHRYEDYEETFPGWDVCYLPNQSWELVEEFSELKTKNQGKWWVPGEEKNDEFTDFVENWLGEWVGYCEETVFDVNVLMLDDKHVCVNNYNEIAFEFFKKHDIEPIITPFRHRFFWDGGLHCITLDLYREGEMEDYFPDRA